ncbi:MAG TPA: hypothetical protein VMU02_10310 [bacterium]|nr:hypothetical protein [bacterium]
MKLRLSAWVAVALGLAALMPGIALAGFLSMEEGARATAMGGAFVGVSDDATAVFWNPAGYGLTHGLKLTAMGTRLFSVSDLSEDCVAVGYSGWHKSGFGFGWTRRGLGDLYNENTFVLGAGRRLVLDGLSVGGALRIYRVSAPGYEYYNDPSFKTSDTGYAGDLGLLYKSRNWSAACVVRNLGQPELSLISTTETGDPIYTEVRLGGTYVFREVMLITGEIRRPSKVPAYYDSKISYYLGTEIWFYDAFALRSGLDRDRATAGVGLKIDKLTVDAALVSDRRPGNKYRLSLSMDF